MDCEFEREFDREFERESVEEKNRRKNRIERIDFGPYTKELHCKLKLIKLLPREAEHKFSLIWLHGLGDSAFGMVSMFDDQSSLVPPTCKVILPTAPKRAITCNNGMRMPGWYDVISFDRPNNLSLAESRALMNQ